MDLSAVKDYAKDALVGKDAITGKIVDGAAGMANFANLADLNDYLAAKLELCSQGEREQIDALGGEVLSKITLVHIEPAVSGCLDGLCGKKRDLTMPMSGMGIGGEAKLLNNDIVSIGDGRLACAFVCRCVD